MSDGTDIFLLLKSYHVSAGYRSKAKTAADCLSLFYSYRDFEAKSEPAVLTQKNEIWLESGISPKAPAFLSASITL